MTVLGVETTRAEPARPRPTRRPRHPVPTALAALVALVVAAPVLTLIGLAIGGEGADWPHLAANVLPGSLRTTLALLAMVAIGSASIGVVSAWLVVAYDFPLRRTFSWALILPLAVPTYLAAYAFAEFFHYSGPVQGAIRSLLGFQTSRDYWFPDIRSTPGAAIVLSSVLFPYVYLTTRIVFLLQGRNLADVARTLGAAPFAVFRRVLLPVARPAILAGLALVMMEAVNDIGAVEYLGVRTLAFSVYSTWLNRGSLEGAAQIALVMLALVVGLVALERWGRRRQRFHEHRSVQVGARPARLRLRGWKALAALVAVAMPVLAGFGIPLLMFARYALRRLDQITSPALHEALLNTVATATLTALVTIGAALALIYALRVARSRTATVLVRIGSIGYALPGTILALGLLFSLAALDNRIDALARGMFGVSTGLLFTGSAAAVVLACSIRFVALAESAIHAGLEKLPPHLDEAARSLGRTPRQAAAGVVLPLLGPAILGAGVLVFVDTAKELSATILLRPFGYNTLATYVYENASRGAVEDGAAAALLIIVTALAPVALLSRALSRDREA